MQTEFLRLAVRFILLVLLQVLVFKNIDIRQFNYLQIFVYPIWIFILPLRIPRSAVILLGFGAGLIVDIFYNTPGVHASAATFAAFCRDIVIKILEPRGGYNVIMSPTIHHLGITWFLRYSSIMYALFLLFYFSVEAFTFAYWQSIILKTVVSFIFSYIIFLAYSFLFNPK